jgi:hypothetical protein
LDASRADGTSPESAHAVPQLEGLASARSFKNGLEAEDVAWYVVDRDTFSVLDTFGVISRLFNTKGTSTGRWSCGKPNLSNVPKGDEGV